MRPFPAGAPPLDRESLRAAIFPTGPWPRDVGAFEARLDVEVGGGPWAWWQVAGLGLRSLAGDKPLYLPERVPGDLRGVGTALPPGSSPAERLAPLKAAPGWVLWCSEAGDPSEVPAWVSACEEDGHLLVVDTRSAPGSRVSDRPCHAWGAAAVRWPDGGPGGGALDGVVIRNGRRQDERGPGSRTSWWSKALSQSWKRDPRAATVRAWLDRGGESTLGEAQHREGGSGSCGPAFAAAWARSLAEPERATQRSRVARELRRHLGHLPGGVECLAEPATAVVAPSFLAFRTARAAVFARALADRRVAALPPFADFGGCVGWADLVRIPVHPFYTRSDLAQLAEQIRRAALSM